MNVAMTEFCNVDGQLGKTVLPFPHKPFTAAEQYAKWDGISAAERVDQIKDRITPDQHGLLLSLIVTASGSQQIRWPLLKSSDGGLSPDTSHKHTWTTLSNGSSSAARPVSRSISSATRWHPATSPMAFHPRCSKLTSPGSRSS